MKILKITAFTLIVLLGLSGCGNSTPYPQQVKSWNSYKDLASYMRDSWSFDTSRQAEFKKDLREYKKEHSGDLSDFTVDELSKTPLQTYNSGSGFCGDSATLIKDALNKIDSNYEAKIIFIWNDEGSPHHWVTGFYVDKKLFIMDYGAGSHWSDMMGTHGPYDSLDDYGKFLDSLSISNFKFGSLRWRD